MAQQSSLLRGLCCLLLGQYKQCGLPSRGVESLSDDRMVRVGGRLLVVPRRRRYLARAKKLLKTSPMPRIADRHFHIPQSLIRHQTVEAAMVAGAVVFLFMQ